MLVGCGGILEVWFSFLNPENHYRSTGSNQSKEKTSQKIRNDQYDEEKNANTMLSIQLLRIMLTPLCGLILCQRRR